VQLNNLGVAYMNRQNMDKAAKSFTNANALPALPAHWKRDYFFYANGFVKNMDFYEASPFTLDKMPFHGRKTYPYLKAQSYSMGPAAVQYRLQWNDRCNSGQTTQEYQFHYFPVQSLPIGPPIAPHAAVSAAKMQGGN
jgi:hypothetical protein